MEALGCLEAMRLAVLLPRAPDVFYYSHSHRSLMKGIKTYQTSPKCCMCKGPAALLNVTWVKTGASNNDKKKQQVNWYIKSLYSGLRPTHERDHTCCPVLPACHNFNSKRVLTLIMSPENHFISIYWTCLALNRPSLVFTLAHLSKRNDALDIAEKYPM